MNTSFISEMRSVLKALMMMSSLLLLTCFTSSAAIEKSGIIHVAKNGKDTNVGTEQAPLLTISKAETMVHPGETIVVHSGVYREMIFLHSGGTAADAQITLKAAQGNEVIIKGSEPIKSWVHVLGNTWKATIEASLFGNFNPFIEFIKPDSSYQHLGEVYLDNQPLKEKKDISQVDKTEGTWLTMQENGKTIIIANFGQKNPNLKLIEINVRPTAISAVKQGIQYVVIDGFKISQVASRMAYIDGIQLGAIATNGGAHWLIQNCILGDCKSVAISIGQTGHAYPGAGPGKPEYSDLSQDITGVGHHVIKHNHIFRCGQAGIFGLLHGSFSTITDNLIEDINSDGDYPVVETAGIHLALLVDAQISHNLIRRINGNSNGYGLFLGPLIQGTSITRNIISDTRQSCIYLYKSHGPTLISNNILYGPGNNNAEGIKMMSAEANVFVQNLFYDCGWTNSKVPGRSFATSNFLPHSLVIKQTIPALPFDDRWYSNVFIKNGLDLLTGYTDCLADYNVFMDGAAIYKWGGDIHSKVINGVIGLKLINTSMGVSLELNDKLIPSFVCPSLNPSFIGFFALSKEYIEYPDGKAITIDRDFNKAALKSTRKLAGPFYMYPAVNSGRQILFTY